jgi:hypothetical protein
MSLEDLLNSKREKKLFVRVHHLVPPGPRMLERHNSDGPTLECVVCIPLFSPPFKLSIAGWLNSIASHPAREKATGGPGTRTAIVA